MHCRGMFFALYLQDGRILTPQGDPANMLTIGLASAGIAISVLWLFNTHKRLWRYLAFKDLGLVS
jgi:hypothetical protein